MRKSLLITTALGLAAALPTLAMAEVAASSSAGAACQSGFFFGIDLKGMTARLRVKKDKDTKTPDAALITDVAALVDAISADINPKVLALKAENVSSIDPDNAVNALTAVPGSADLATIGAAVNATTPITFGKTAATDRIALSGLLVDNRYIEDTAAATALTGTTARAHLTQFVLSQLWVGNGGGTAATVANAAAPAVSAANNAAYVAVGNTAQLKPLVDAVEAKVKAALAIAKPAADNSPTFSNLTPANRTIFSLFNTRSQIYSISDDKTIYIGVTGATAGTAIAGNAALNPALTDATAINSILLSAGASAQGKTIKILTTNLNAADTPATITAGIVTAWNVQAVQKTYKDGLLVNKSVADKVAANKALNDAKATATPAGATEHHSAMMGGLGLTAGYRHVLGQCALSARLSGDYLWGSFRRVDIDGKDDNNKQAKLGFGISPAIGVHFLASPSAELGLVGGVRFGELQARKVDATGTDSKSGDYVSKWIWMPFVQGEATVWFTQNVSGSVYAGYHFPVEQTFDKDKTVISSGADDKKSKVKVDGVFGGFRVAYHF